MNELERNKCNLVYKPPAYDFYISWEDYNNTKARRRDRCNIVDERQDKNNYLTIYKNKPTKQATLNQIDKLINGEL